MAFFSQVFGQGIIKPDSVNTKNKTYFYEFKTMFDDVDDFNFVEGSPTLSHTQNHRYSALLWTGTGLRR